MRDGIYASEGVSTSGVSEFPTMKSLDKKDQ